MIRVNGQAIHRTSFRVAFDALRAHEDIVAAFAMNDHGAEAVLEAAARVGRRIRVYATGGEAPDFVAGLHEERGLSAVAAFFPEVVGAKGSDLVANALPGRPPPPAAVTPHVILTRENLGDWCQRDEAGWRLRPERRDVLIGRPAPERPTAGSPGGRLVGFMPHYPAHDWYRIMSPSMQARAQAWGLSVIVSLPHQGIAAELARLRRMLAVVAVDRIEPGQTVILVQGEATCFMAEEIRRRMVTQDARLAGVTVVTNALDVMHRLEDVPAIKVVLTSGVLDLRGGLADLAALQDLHVQGGEEAEALAEAALRLELILDDLAETSTRAEMPMPIPAADGHLARNVDAAVRSAGARTQERLEYVRRALA